MDLYRLNWPGSFASLSGTRPHVAIRASRFNFPRSSRPPQNSKRGSPPPSRHCVCRKLRHGGVQRLPHYRRVASNSASLPSLIRPGYLHFPRVIVFLLLLSIPLYTPLHPHHFPKPIMTAQPKTEYRRRKQRRKGLVWVRRPCIIRRPNPTATSVSKIMTTIANHQSRVQHHEFIHLSLVSFIWLHTPLGPLYTSSPHAFV